MPSKATALKVAVRLEPIWNLTSSSDFKGHVVLCLSGFSCIQSGEDTEALWLPSNPIGIDAGSVHLTLWRTRGYHGD